MERLMEEQEVKRERRLENEIMENILVTRFSTRSLIHCLLLTYASSSAYQCMLHNSHVSFPAA